MKISRQRYQTGSIRKVPRSHGFAWEFRFYCTGPDGVRRLKVQTFDSDKYGTERDVRLAVQGQLAALNADKLDGKVNTTFNMVFYRYPARRVSQAPPFDPDNQRKLSSNYIFARSGKTICCRTSRRWRSSAESIRFRLARPPRSWPGTRSIPSPGPTPSGSAARECIPRASPDIP